VTLACSSLTGIAADKESTDDLTAQQILATRKRDVRQQLVVERPERKGAGDAERNPKDDR
jgi:hypothetical protein